MICEKCGGFDGAKLHTSDDCIRSLRDRLAKLERPNWWPIMPVPGCNCNQPLFMVIPPEGVDIYCPVHGTRRVFGPGVTWSTT